MKSLLKAIRSSEDLTCLFNFCENNGIEMSRKGYAITLKNIQTGVINWGGYGSSFSIGPNLFNYLTLKYPDGDPPRGKTFAHVKMIFNGDLKNNDTEEVIQRIEKLGGLVVQNIDKKINLIVNGKDANKQLVKKAEKLNHVLILDEKRFIEILPAIRKKPIKRKVKPRKDLPNTVDKKVLNNLKKLFISRDNDLISQGLEMFRSLENADVSKYFLDEVQYATKADGRLIPNPIFSGTAPAQPYLNYALLGVIAYAPDDCEIANNLKNSVKFLDIETTISSPLAAFQNLESLDLSNSEGLEDLDGIASLKKLQHIEINNCNALKSLKGIASLKKLQHIEINNCNALKSLKGLLNKNLKMTSLDLRNFRYLENLEGVQSMNNLKKIVLVGCDKLKNVDALKNLTHLKEVEMDGLRALESLEGLKVLEKSRTELDLYGFDSIKNLKGIQNFHKLQSLSITNNSLTDITALKGLKSLKKLYISSDNLTLLKGIGSLPKLEILDIYVRIVKSLDGLKNLTALDKMVINCDKLNSLKGLEQAPNITDLTICSKDLKDITRINSLTKLKTLDLSSCNSIQNLHGLEKLNFLESINVNDCSKLVSLQGVPNPNVFGSDVSFDNCSSLKDITALKGISKIERMSLDGCSSISKTEGLENIEIESLSCSDMNINALQNLSNLKVKTLHLYLGASGTPTSLEGFKVWESVTDLTVHKKSFKSLIGIDAFPNINYLSLEKCERLINLIGIEKLKHLEKLDLTGCTAMKEVSSLSELPNLAELKMDGCTQVDPLPRPKVMEDREKVEKYQLRLLKALGKDVPVTAKKKSIGSKNNKPSVDKKTFSKVKKLLTVRDINLINQGLELVRSLEDHSLYQKLLKGIQYKIFKSKTWNAEEQVKGRLVPNSTFKGTGPAQPYLNYAMRELINNAPNDFVQKIRNEVKDLQLDVFGDISNFTNLEKLSLSYSYNSPESYKPTISSLNKFSVFEKLTYLDIYGYFIPDDQDLKGLSNLKKLRELNLSGGSALKTLIGMENCRELQKLDIEECTKLIDVEGLSGCQELKSIKLSSAKRLKNLNGLKGLKSLKTINIDAAESLENLDGLKGCSSLVEINISNSESLKNLDGLHGCNSLEKITISGGSWDGNSKKQPIKNVDGLRGLKNLKDVDLSIFTSLKNVDGLRGCSVLESLRIESDSLENINGLQNLKALNYFYLDAIKLKNIDGLSGCENLEDFDIQSENIENLNGLKGCNKLKTLNIPGLAKSLNLDGLAYADGLRRINFSGCNLTSFDFTQKIPRIMGIEIKSCNQIKSLEGLGNLINLTKLVIKNCTKLENLKGLEGIKTLESVIIQDCKSLKDVDALLSLPKLDIFKIRSCGIKKEELPGHLKVIVKTTISYYDDLPHDFDDNK